jgi:predicted Zn finger-like uncharacterized protein
MIIQCKSCSRKFIVKDINIPKNGRMVKCGYCSVSWHQMPILLKTEEREKPDIIKTNEDVDESPSVDKIKASDGKTYKFLGSQWVELFSSGKTGLFARKKISQELDEVTGRKQVKGNRKRQKKTEEMDPSSVNLENSVKLPDVYKPKGMGFFSYLFLIIIISFSLIGVLKTFENDLSFYFPEIEPIFISLNEQLIYIAETVKNIVTIIKDLIKSY